MNTTIWILQGILATVFSLSGIIIYALRDKFRPKLSWLRVYSPAMVLFICAAKVLGAIGLILPMYLNIWPVLTPLAALGLATIMILAILYHIRNKEFKDLPAPIIFLTLSLLVAYFRF